jgi:cytidylate kinase
MPVVTIRGRLGSGAPEVGKLVASQLHIDYIDRELINEVAARLNLEEQEIIRKEMPPARLQERIAEALARGYSIGDGIQGAYLPFSQIPLDDSSYLEALTTLIKELAQGHSAVIYGRGSQFILKDYPETIHISMVAPNNIRLKRVIETQGLSEDKAKQEMQRFDSGAREFMKRFFSAEMEDPTKYDLVINTENYSYQAAANLIIQALSLKQNTRV